MRRNSFTWLSSVLLVVVVLAVDLQTSAVAGVPSLPPIFECLPPIFEGGQRLHELRSRSVYWLELGFRQHEVCWRRFSHPDEVRVFLAGNSAVYGFPLPAEESLSGVLNRRFNDNHIGAHVFNLAAVLTYQLKDALILHESIPYRPDLIVYAVSLAEFEHYPGSPKDFADLSEWTWRSLVEFFASNRNAVLAFAGEQPPGLSEPLETYRQFLMTPAARLSRSTARGQVGALIRAIARAHAETLLRRALPDLPVAPLASAGRQTTYDCEKITREREPLYRHWQDWNIIAFLERLQASTRAPVLVVNWPVAHEPVGDCYNVRYPAAALQAYDEWLRAETEKRGLRYLDLQQLLPAEDFIDSLHVTAEGQRKIASAISPDLERLVQDVARSPRAMP